MILTLLDCSHRPPDYPRTLRTWGLRLEENLRQEVVAKEIPALQDPSEYATFKRKWEYLFAYAGEGFARGYITCHMLTFIRPVRESSIFGQLFLLTTLLGRSS